MHDARVTENLFIDYCDSQDNKNGNVVGLGFLQSVYGDIVFTNM